MPESDRTATRAQEKDFFLQALEQADESRSDDRAIDQEVLENYMVLPPGGRGYRRSSRKSPPRMVDPETHNVIETLIAIQMLSIMGEKGYISARPVGREDATSGGYAGRLLERSHRIRGNYRSLYTWLKNTTLFGASVVFPSWVFLEGARTRRVFDIDPLSGAETFEDIEFIDVLKNDIELNVIDNMDFFPDPSADTIERMQYAIRRFTLPKYQAKQLADEGRWDAEATRRALAGGKSTEGPREDNEWRAEIDRQEVDDLPEPYEEVVGYEMYALVPYRTRDRVRNRRLTMLNGELVETRPNPSGVTRVIPYYEGVINPIQGRFRGIAPGAVARFSQDFTNGLLMNLATAVSRQTQNPIVYNQNLQVNQQRLEEWRGPIPVMGDPSQIKALEYNPPLQEAFMLWQAMTTKISELSGAQDGVQGRGFGTKRMSATETSVLFQQQINRPNLMAQLYEVEWLPNLAQGQFEMYQRFLEGTDDLRRRIGASSVDQQQPYIEDIHGDYDIEFIGSQRMQSKQVKLQFLKEAMQIFGAVPGAAPIFPWAQALTQYLEAADLRDLEKMVASRSGVEQFIGLNFLQQGGANPAAGNGNAASVSLPQSEASGLLPAQAAGQAAQ